MQPESHRLVIRLGLGAAGAPVLLPHLSALIAGNDAEDSYTWPLIGARTPAIGLTHTYRPGRSRGELGMPSARTRCGRLFRRAAAGFAGDPGRAGALLGGACHLLTDAAVPARTRGVWH